nr:terminal uridylyltransferase cid1 [Quercus suber]
MEDQVRRMILESSAATREHEHSTPAVRPIVRLPTAPLVSDYVHYERSNHVPPRLQQGNRYGQIPATDTQDAGSGFVLPDFRHEGIKVPSHSQNMSYARKDYIPPHLRRKELPSAAQSDSDAVFNQQETPSPRQSQTLPPHIRAAQRHGQRKQVPLDHYAFNRGGSAPRSGAYHQQRQTQRQLFDPASRAPQQSSPYAGQQARHYSDQHMRQAEYLDDIAASEIAMIEMTTTERNEKERFRVDLQTVISKLCEADSERLPRISLQCFGSFQSGFASRGSDMDLAIVSEDQSRDSACFSLMDRDLPRTLEKKLLELGYGARLLTRTRVPIIKICEKPPAELLANLKEEREKWDVLPDEKKYPHLYGDEEADPASSLTRAREAIETKVHETAVAMEAQSVVDDKTTSIKQDLPNGQGVFSTAAKTTELQTAEKQAVRQRRDQKWTRERKSGPLDFPKDGIGIQSDINFFNPLGLHNTQMMRNYSLCDPRVRPIILFVKAWAKRRKINSAYSGTLSSYGYVLMVLHYMINIAQPAVLPNLQSSWRPKPTMYATGSHSNRGG